MCGIAGISFSGESPVRRTLAAQALLAGISERGSDACGCAFRSEADDIVVRKQRFGASRLLEHASITADATELLLHVRASTKGHAAIEGNNHPIRHGSVVGVHNGIIANDDEVLHRYAIDREEPGATVDSEAIFALVERTGGRPEALEELRGSMAAAWLDERRAGVLLVARGAGRPLWIGEGGGAAAFASTERALVVAERYTGLDLRKREVAEGTLVCFAHSRVVSVDPFTPNGAAHERRRTPVPAVQEWRSCLRLLDGLAAAAAR